MNLVRPPAAKPGRAPHSVLIVSTQRLGDVLLATPLIRSVRRAWPQAAVHALVFDDTRSVLEANPDVDAILTVPRRPRRREHLRLLRCLWRRYDIGIAVGAGDRPLLYAVLAGRHRVGFTLPDRPRAWKRWLLDRHVEFDDLDTHTVVMNLRLADALGIARNYDVTLAWSEADLRRVRTLGTNRVPYAVLHVSAKFSYKNWHADGWAQLAAWLIARGLRIVFTGSRDATEQAAIDAVRRQLRTPSAVAVMTDLTLPQVGCLVAGAALVVGPDTIVTHAAAAVGAPTVALFGPSNPVKWGPWPRGVEADPSPYRMRGSQTVGRVILLQGEGGCVPCRQEGCDRHTQSLSRCLQELPAQRVIAAAGRLLALAPAPVTATCDTSTRASLKQRDTNVP